jgi:hypothetical protein
MPFSIMQRVFIVEHYFRTQSYGAVKQAYQMHFYDAAEPDSSTMFRLVNHLLISSQSFYECVETG